MSRRRGEFEHRTSIFEGAFRAWSHLGGLSPFDLETKTAADLDPLSNPISNDPRIGAGKKGKKGAAAAAAAAAAAGRGSDGDNSDGGGGGGGGGGSADGGSGSTPPPPGGGGGGGGGGSSGKQEYPYEPLPRQGLSHPFVQAILSPWLGPDADQDAIQLGLTTLRTWWQHRRKGESGSAKAALGTDKMRGVVEGYTRHFFNLAHCLVTNDGEQPPRTLMAKMKEIEKERNKKNKKRARDAEAGKLAALALNAAGQHGLPGVGGGVGGGPLPNGGGMGGQVGLSAASAAAVGGGGGCCDAPPPASAPHHPGAPGAGAGAGAGADDGLTPLERLHAAQRRQLAESGFGSASQGGDLDANGLPRIDMRGRCVAGKIDLPGIVSQVSSHANQLAHRGAQQRLSGATPVGAVPSSASGGLGGMAMGVGPPPGVGGLNRAGSYGSSMVDPQQAQAQAQARQYGDPTKTPVVFVSENGDIQVAMSVDGITCAHCVKIVETVLRGCNGNRSPIDGLLDAAADRALNSVLIKIDRSSSARRVAFESARNLAMVGYTAKAKEMSIDGSGCCGGGGGAGAGAGGMKIDMGLLSTAFDVVATTEKTDVFDWTLPCSCPDNGILREDCARHSQMNKGIFAAFERREEAVTKYIAGCGQLHGLPCSCGPNCKCASCDGACQANQQQRQQQQQAVAAGRQQQQQQQQMVAGGQQQQQQQQQVVAGGQQQPDSAQLMLQQIQQQQQQLLQQQHAMAGMGGGGGGGGPNQALPNGLALQQQQQQQQHGGMGGQPLGQQMPGMSAERLAQFMDGGGAAELPHQRGGGGAADLGPNQRGSIGSWDARRVTRDMSITSESGFGRAMSGLSALSIDWENMDDFDVNVDHSAHINDGPVPGAVGPSPGKGPPLQMGMFVGGAAADADGIMEGCGMLKGGQCNCGPACVCVGCPIHDQATALPNIAGATEDRRSSLRTGAGGNPSVGQNMQVSFKT